MTIVTLDPDTLPGHHICCAFSDKKCATGYAAKKQWLSEQYAAGYRFSRLDERGKVFIEYGLAEEIWMPIIAPGWIAIGCFWVSGRFKGNGHGKALLETATTYARDMGSLGLVTATGHKKLAFQSDGAWLKRQGFGEVDRLETGFSLLARALDGTAPAPSPRFAQSAHDGLTDAPKGVVAYYSNRCPYTEFHIHTSLQETCQKRGLALDIRKLDSRDAAQSAPSPATIFSLFFDGKFITTDISACMDSHFDKAIKKARG